MSLPIGQGSIFEEAPMPSYQFGHIHLNAHDLDAAIAFYQHMFGATLLSKTENLPGRFSAALDIHGLRILISN